MPQSAYPRNVLVYDANVPTGTNPILVGGAMQLGSTTANEFYFCLRFCFSDPPQGHFRLLDNNGVILLDDSTYLQPGIYYVVTEGSCWFFSC